VKRVSPSTERPGRWAGLVLRRVAVPIAALVACGLILVVLHRLTAGIDYHAMIRALRRTPHSAVMASVAATALSFLALIGRDVCALRYVGVRIPPSALLLASFCGSALGNAVGFGTLTGGAVRYRVYGAVGVQPEQIGRIMLFITAGFALGLAGVGAVSAIVAAGPVAELLQLPATALRLAGGAVLLATVGVIYIGARRRRPVRLGPFTIKLPNTGLLLIQLALTAVDLIAAAAALWVLLPAGRIDFVSFAAIFSAGTALGVISHVPGGIGVFEAVVIFALGQQVPPSLVAASLLAYRGIYFLLPLVLSAILLAGFELRQVAAKATSGASENVLRAVHSLAPLFLGALTAAVGIMLMVSGVTPAYGRRLAALQSALPLWAIETSSFLASLAGVFLLFVARGLFHRLDGAWWLALIIAVANLGFSLAKGLAFGETAAIAVLILLLLATRREFTRPASFLDQPFTLGWFTAIAVVIAGSSWILFIAFQEVAYSRDLWWQFEFDAQAPRALRALLGAALLALGIALWQLLRPAPGRVAPPTSEELAQATRIIRSQDRSDALLAMMGDKSFLFSASGRSLLMYAKRGRSWIALFDPVGPREEWSELVWRLVELADANGGRAAFYQVRADSLPLYLDAGLKIMKLGEEAIIRLSEFALEGSKRTGLRYALKRGERDGLTLEILTPEETQRNLGTLSAISQAWLETRRAREKGFSVAAFAPHFIAAQSTALLRQHGEPVAFATFMTTNHQTEATVGIMRQTPEAPSCAMEFLFTRLALHLKAAGFESLSLGMAPLSGIAQTPLSSHWHRIAGLLREHAGRVYNFQGLRTFKSKFHPDWQPRYLAASGMIGPFVSLADVAVLAGGRA
jgi:phosphatidylglycerol lysyltransferase